MLIPADAMLKRGLRKNDRLSIGSGVRSSQRMNAAASASAIPKQLRIVGVASRVSPNRIA
jgi:hypothetical protein